MKDMLANVILVVVNSNGRVLDYREIGQYLGEDISTFLDRVGKERVALGQTYPRETIHEGVADSLGTLLRSYPEVTYSPTR